MLSRTSIITFRKPPLTHLAILPPGATTRVLPDGRIAIVTPFSKEKIRELKRREAERLRIRKTRTQELTKQGKNKSLFPRLPGEFEKTKAIILSICDWQPHNFDVLIDLIEKTRGHANLLLLYNDDLKSGDKDSFSELLKKLLRTGKDYRHMRTSQTPVSDESLTHHRTGYPSRGCASTEPIFVSPDTDILMLRKS